MAPKIRALVVKAKLLSSFSPSFSFTPFPVSADDVEVVITLVGVALVLEVAGKSRWKLWSKEIFSMDAMDSLALEAHPPYA